MTASRTTTGYRVAAVVALASCAVTSIASVARLWVVVGVAVAVAIAATLVAIAFMLRASNRAAELRATRDASRFSAAISTARVSLEAAISDAQEASRAALLDDGAARLEVERKLETLKEMTLRAAQLNTELADGVNSLVREVETLGARSQQVASDLQVTVKKLDEAAARSNRLRAVMLEGFRATRVNIEYAPQAVDQYRTMREALAPQRQTMPLTGGWALTAGAVTEIVDRIGSSERPLTVLELGSGVSTIWASLAMRQRGGGMILSLEHKPEFLAASASDVEKYGAPEHVRLIHAPLQTVEIEDEQFEWYELAGVPIDTPIDLLVIDGPPGADGRLTRFPALHMLESRLAKGAIILFDDTIRIEERRTIDRWLATFDGLEVERRLEKATVLRWNGQRE